MTHAYLSGPIIHDELRMDDFYKLVVETLEKRMISVFAPQFLPKVSAEEIYTRDVDQVRKCDFLIAEVSNPSLGVGMEIMLAIELMKPVLLFRHTESKRLSLMVLGAKGTVLFEYNNIDEVVDFLSSINLDDLIMKKCPICNGYIGEMNEDGIRCIKCQSTNP
ncbi:MAG: nucleoside 2-deoxyribosyltransferase [Candidatus Thorarchaeota archaeon]